MNIHAKIITALSMAFFLNVNAYAISEAELEKQLLEQSMQDAAVDSANAKSSKPKVEHQEKEIKQQKSTKTESNKQFKLTKEHKADTKIPNEKKAQQKEEPKQQQSAKTVSPPLNSSKNQKKVADLTIGKVKIKVGMTQDDFLKLVSKKEIVSEIDKPDPANQKNHFIEKDCKVDGKEFAVILARKPDPGPYRIITILTKK